MSLNFPKEGDECWDDIVREKSDKNWMAIGYGRGNTMKLIASGTGGLNDCVKKAFKKDIVYAGIRVIGTDKNGDNRRSKFVLISFIPNSIGGMKKARASMHRNAVKKFYKFNHVSMQIGVKREASEERVREKLAGTGGSDTSEKWIFNEKGGGGGGKKSSSSSPPQRKKRAVPPPKKEKGGAPPKPKRGRRVPPKKRAAPPPKREKKTAPPKKRDQNPRKRGGGGKGDQIKKLTGYTEKELTDFVDGVEKYVNQMELKMVSLRIGQLGIVDDKDLKFSGLNDSQKMKKLDQLWRKVQKA